jgi:hypothetical protein
MWYPVSMAPEVTQLGSNHLPRVAPRQHPPGILQGK